MRILIGFALAALGFLAIIASVLKGSTEGFIYGFIVVVIDGMFIREE